MAVTAQLTTVWRKRIEGYLDTLSVFKDALCNTHYEGDLKENATLKIVSMGDVAESAYTGGWTDADFAALATTDIEFTLDQKRKILFAVPDTTQQGSGAYRLMDEGSKRAAYAVNNRSDQYIASLHTQINTNLLGSDAAPITVGFDQAAGEVLPSAALATLLEIMTEANADMSEPRVVVPVWLGSYLYQEFSGRNTVGGDASSTMGALPGKMQGLAGNAGGFSGIYISNNVASTGGAGYKVMAGTPGVSITFASAIDKFEMGRLQNDFADFAKGLRVYGGLIPFPQHMGLATLNKGTRK